MNLLNKIFSIPLIAFALRVLAWVLAGNLFFRLIFLAWNFSAWSHPSALELIQALLAGLRFDLAVTFITSGVLILFFITPSSLLKRKKTWMTGVLLFTIVNFPVWVLNGADVIYYGYSRKRLSHELFTLGDEIFNFKFADVLPWVWILLPIVVFTFLFWRGIKKIATVAYDGNLKEGNVPLSRYSAIPFIAAAMFIGIRGGLQTKPLRPSMAFVTNDFFLGNLGNNSAFNVLYSMNSGKEKAISWIPEPRTKAILGEMLRNDFDSELVSPEFPVLRKAEFQGPEKRMNVVILILESMNAELLSCIHPDNQKRLSPFLDSLAGTGQLFTNFYANGTRSVESLPAILNSIPDIFLRPLIGSAQETQTHWGIGNMLSARGYHTSFFCGGENGTMGFDSYSRISGFQHYYGKNEYPGTIDKINSHWGLHDGPFLDWMAEMQNSFPKPFLSAWFSISNHYPFEIPADCPSSIQEKNLTNNEKTVMYTDYALSRYFRKISAYPCYSNTVFLITADHCFFGRESNDISLMDNFHVPLILIGPGIEAQRVERLGSHLSILPTLIELLRLDTWHGSANVSLWSKTKSPFAIGNTIGVITCAQDSLAFNSNFQNDQPCYRYEQGKWEAWREAQNSQKGKQMEEKLKAFYQVFNNVRVNNTLISPPYMKAAAD